MRHEPRPANRVGLRLDVSPEYRDRLQVAAAKRGQTMAACLRQFVTEWIDANEPAPKKPRKRTLS